MELGFEELAIVGLTFSRELESVSKKSIFYFLFFIFFYLAFVHSMNCIYYVMFIFEGPTLL